MADLGWIVGAYLVCLAWVIVVRGFVGLSGPCVQSEGLGPLAAIARSTRLLSGRRLQMIGLRLVWGLIAGALYVVTYLPMLLFVGAGSADGSGS